MLIQKSKFDDGDIVSIKLVNGDEIVSKITSQSDGVFMLNRPCVVIPSQQGIGLMQSLFSANADKDIELKSQHIMMMAPTHDQIKNHYIQTTTGIQPVTKGSIIA
jgi:hypothetical protein